MVRDADHIIRDGSVDLIIDETIAFTVVGGVPREHPMMMHILVPTLSASDTLDITLRCVSTGEKITVSHTDTLTQGTTTVPFEMKLPFPPSEGTLWELFLDVGGSAVDHGAVEAWIEMLSGYAKVDGNA